MVFHDFPWLATGEGGHTMLIYYNAIIMKQGSCSVFCAGPFMSHHDSALFQKAGSISLRTGSLSRIDVLYLSPGAPPGFPPSWLSPASKPLYLKKKMQWIKRFFPFIFWPLHTMILIPIRKCRGCSTSPLQANLQHQLGGLQLTQFWHHLPRNCIRFHRLGTSSHKPPPILLMTTASPGCYLCF